MEDHESAELQLHQLFNESRVSQNREFFELNVHEALPKIREVLSPSYEDVYAQKSRNGPNMRCVHFSSWPGT